MEKLPLELTKLLYMRFASTYGEKFVKNHPTDQFVQLWWEEWSEGMAGIDPKHIKEGLSFCRLNLEWPPSIAEFRRICEQNAGVPTVDDALQLAIRREFTHPIVSIAFDKVGSWAMKNDKAQELKGKFQIAYTYALNQFRVNPNETWKQLEQFNEKLLLPEPPPKIPSPQECKKFSERLAEYQAMAKEAKSKLEVKDHPIWPKKAITRGHKQFDQRIYDERKDYLLKVDEYVAGTLSSEDWYDRIRYKREIEGIEAIKNNTPGVDTPQQEKTSHKRYTASKTVYQNWNN